MKVIVGWDKIVIILNSIVVGRNTVNEARDKPTPLMLDPLGKAYRCGIDQLIKYSILNRIDFSH